MYYNATVKYVKKLSSDEVTLVITGRDSNGSGGDEDLACAEYLQALLEGEQPNLQPFIQRVLTSRDASQHFDPHKIGFPITDLDYCTQIDKFDFAMPVERNDGRLIMRCTKPSQGQT